MERGIPSDVEATADFVREAIEHLAAMPQSPGSTEMEDVAAVVERMFGQAAALDSEKRRADANIDEAGGGEDWDEWCNRKFVALSGSK